LALGHVRLDLQKTWFIPSKRQRLEYAIGVEFLRLLGNLA